jgi:hypothetical protein
MLNEGINIDGILVGASLMVIMWVGRMACIKGEYYFTKKFWVAFLLIGIISVGSALFVESLIFSSILSIFGFTFLWGIHEIIEQEERVSKGWFPARKQKRKDG